MSVMFEVLYQTPTDPKREAGLTECVEKLGGRLDYHEEPTIEGGPICLTYEFGDWSIARQAAEHLRSRGEHVDGPHEYAD